MPGLTSAPQAFRATLRAKDDRPVRPQHSYALRLQVHRGVYVAVEVRTAFRARPRSNRQIKLVSFVPALRARFRGREVGIDANDGGLRAYTYGPEAFGHREIEVLDAEGADARELWAFISSTASYVLECGRTLEDGQTIGFSKNDKHAVTLSEGAALPGMTLKIAYGNGMPAA